MELITTESFVTPLKGFLTLPSGTEEKKSNIITCKLDDKPCLYIIGSIRNVNQKIAHLELGLKRYDSNEVVIEDTALKRHVAQRGVKKGRGASKMKERDQKSIQKSGGRGSESDPLTAQGKIAQKKIVTEKDKLVELYKYPGFSKEKSTPLPNGIELDEILEKVIRAQRKTLIGKTSWSVKMLRRFLSAPCVQAILLDSFWWQFLHLYHPNREIQGLLFERVAENYSRTLLGYHKVSNPEHILTLFPSLLSQAVYTCFCYCFPRSWFNTHEFKAQLCDVFYEWFGGTLHAPGSYSKWDYSQLEPERSRREDLLSGKSQLRTASDVSFSSDMLSSALGRLSLRFQKRHSSSGKVVSKSIKKVKKPISKKKAQQHHSKKEEDWLSQFASGDDQVKEDGQKDSWSKHQSSQKKKKLKIALLPRELFSVIIGVDFSFIHQITDSAQTYAEVVKESFNILCQRQKAFRKTYLRHQKEMRNFDQQCKDNQELLRQEMQEEMKRRQAQKQKELLTAEALHSSEKISTHLPRVSFTLP